MEYRNVHTGQYRRYGDFYRVYDIITKNENKEEVLQFCQTEVYQGIYPNKEEFFRRYNNGDKKGDYGYYFHGYCTLVKINCGWEYTICEPYAD